MSFSNSLKFTNAGREVQLQSLTGKALMFTTVRMGDGELSSAISVMTDLINERVSVTVNSVAANSQYALIEAIFKNTDLSEGFYWRELGVYVADPDDPDNRNSDILYAYQNAGELAEYINSSGSSIIEKIIRIPVFVGEAENVSVAVDSVIQQDATVTQSEETTADDNDYMTFYDTSTMKNKKISFANIRDKLLSVHNADKNNPHEVTYSQTGAAAEKHTHEISDINELTDKINNHAAYMLSNRSEIITLKNTVDEMKTANDGIDVSDSFGEVLNDCEINYINVYKFGKYISGTISFTIESSPTSLLDSVEAFKISDEYIPVFQNAQILPYCAYKADSEDSETISFIPLQCVLEDRNIIFSTNEWGAFNVLVVSFSYICS